MFRFLGRAVCRPGDRGSSSRQKRQRLCSKEKPIFASENIDQVCYLFTVGMFKFKDSGINSSPSTCRRRLHDGVTQAHKKASICWCRRWKTYQWKGESILTDGCVARRSGSDAIVASRALPSIKIKSPKAMLLLGHTPSAGRRPFSG